MRWLSVLAGMCFTAERTLVTSSDELLVPVRK